MLFVHVLLLVYWLGADLGVYLCAKYVGRDDLSTEERGRFLRLLLQMDMGPRTALVLMIPSGVLLASLGGWIMVPPAVTFIVCAVALAWLALVWRLHRRRHAAVWLGRIDLGLRWVVILLATLPGLAIMTGALPGAPRWLGAKLLAYGAAVGCGLLLRRVLKRWAEGFAELADPATRDQGNRRIAAAMPAAFRYAHALWACVLASAFLGIGKPF